MYNILISAKIEFNKKIQTKNKNCQCEYKININLLAEKTKKQPIPNNIHKKPQKKKKTMEKHR